MGAACGRDALAGAQETYNDAALRDQERADAAREAAQATALVTGGLAHSSTVELRFQCTNLCRMDLLSKSDPMACLYELVDGGWKELGRTEVQNNNQSPFFHTAIKVMYSFQQPTRLKLVLVDVDDVESAAHVDPAACDQLGSLEFDLVEVVTQPNRQLSRALSKAYHPDVDSQVLLLAEELLEARQVLTLHLAAVLQGLGGEEAEHRPDPFLLVSKYLAAEGAGWVPVFRTEVQHSSVNPSWHSFSLKATQLNSGDRSRPLKLQVFDWQVDDNHRLLAQAETTTHQLLQLAGVQGSLELLGPQSQAPAGQLTVLGLKVSEEPSFLDFIKAGVELSFLEDPDADEATHLMKPFR